MAIVLEDDTKLLIGMLNDEEYEKIHGDILEIDSILDSINKGIDTIMLFVAMTLIEHKIPEEERIAILRDTSMKLDPVYEEFHKRYNDSFKKNIRSYLFRINFKKKSNN